MNYLKEHKVKTEQEVQEANRKAQEIEEEAEREEKAARGVFNKATEKESKKFEKAVRPAQERWKKFSSPHLMILSDKLSDIRKAKNNAIAGLQASWENCPECGTPYGRYQVCCGNDKCKLNLVLEKPKGT